MTPHSRALGCRGWSGAERVDLAGIPLVFIVFELHEDPPRRVGLEYSFGKRGAARYPVGRTVKVKVDPNDPDLITMGE